MTRSKTVIKKIRFRDELIFDTIVAMALNESENGVKPESVAIFLHPDDWQSLLKRVRLFARQLAHQGVVEIVRKGEVADPDDFRGLYRIRPTAQGSAYIPRTPKE